MFSSNRQSPQSSGLPFLVVSLHATLLLSTPLRSIKGPRPPPQNRLHGCAACIVSHAGPQAQKGPSLVSCFALAILKVSNFWTVGLTLSFCSGPYNLCSRTWHSSTFHPKELGHCLASPRTQDLFLPQVVHTSPINSISYLYLKSAHLSYLHFMPRLHCRPPNRGPASSFLCL